MEQHAPPRTDAAASGQPAPALLIVAMLCLALVSAHAAYRVRHQPWDLAFVVFAYVALVVLFLCLRMYDRLAQESAESHQVDGDGERRRRRRRWWLKLSVWTLSTALSVAFAWRVAAVVLPALKPAVWGMTCAVALAGFYVMFLCEGSGGYSSKTDNTTCQEATRLKPEQTV